MTEPPPVMKIVINATALRHYERSPLLYYSASMAVCAFRKPLECIAAYSLRNASLQKLKTPTKVCYKVGNWSSPCLYSTARSRDHRHTCCCRLHASERGGKTWRGLLTARCCKPPAMVCSWRCLHTSRRKST